MGGSGSGRTNRPDHVLASGSNVSRRVEPIQVPDFPIRCPAWLPKGLARQTWKRTLKLVLGMGLMTAADVPVLARYCVTYTRWQAIEESLFTLPVGGVKYTRAHRQAKELSAQLRALEAQLGLTPKARRHLASAATPAAPTPIEDGKPKPESGAGRFFGS